ncbi:hypothetical protein F4703DRAFT_1847174, partial [Phycomyces blakesleeanus]
MYFCSTFLYTFLPFIFSFFSIIPISYLPISFHSTPLHPFFSFSFSFFFFLLLGSVRHRPFDQRAGNQKRRRIRDFSFQALHFNFLEVHKTKQKKVCPHKYKYLSIHTCIYICVCMYV